jgi:hypothetical protein
VQRCISGHCERQKGQLVLVWLRLANTPIHIVNNSRAGENGWGQGGRWIRSFLALLLRTGVQRRPAMYIG